MSFFAYPTSDDTTWHYCQLHSLIMIERSQKNQDFSRCQQRNRNIRTLKLLTGERSTKEIEHVYKRFLQDFFDGSEKRIRNSGINEIMSLMQLPQSSGQLLIFLGRKTMLIWKGSEAPRIKKCYLFGDCCGIPKIPRCQTMNFSSGGY